MDEKQKLHLSKARIRQVFLEYWDPIGIRFEPMAHHEYDAYVGGMYVLLRHEADIEEIVDYLFDAETKRMGLSRSRDLLYPVADALLDLYLTHEPPCG